MQILSPGVFRVTDGETVIVDVRATGNQTQFLVNYAIFDGTEGNRIHEGEPARIVMTKARATGPSTIPNARTTVLTLTFTFNSISGGSYELTVSGDGPQTHPDFADQHGNIPAVIPYTFHIV